MHILICVRCVDIKRQSIVWKKCSHNTLSATLLFLDNVIFLHSYGHDVGICSWQAAELDVVCTSKKTAQCYQV